MESPLAIGIYEAALIVTGLLGMVTAVYALAQAALRRWAVWPSIGLALIALVPFVGGPLALGGLLLATRRGRNGSAIQGSSTIQS